MKVDQNLLFIASELGDVDEEKFLMFYDMRRTRNLNLPYWKYEKFDLDHLENDECVAEFRFQKDDIYDLPGVLQVPDEIVCYNGTKVSDIEALCIFLKRHAYPCRYLDLIHRFARPVPELCIINNFVLKFLYERWGHLFTTMNQQWLSPNNLQVFANAIHDKGAPLENCWGFVDGTVRPLCRPGENQRIMYNGHKKVHAIKFQSVVEPNGLIANLFGPVEGRRHDSGMLGDSGLLRELQQHAHGPNGNILCIYGDPAYPLRQQLMGPFRGAATTPLQDAWNKSMSQSRTSVEWIFGDIINYFKFLDFKKGLKLQLSAVGKKYIVCAMMQNARTCLYSNTTSEYFRVPPIPLAFYFQ